MPIKPENKNKYPKNWKEISNRIRFERANGQCECVGECGLHPGARCVEKHGEPAQFAKGKIVLTTAHRNNIESDCRDENLFAACQRCHLRYDTQHHKKNSAETRSRKQSAGLFSGG